MNTGMFIHRVLWILTDEHTNVHTLGSVILTGDITAVHTLSSVILTGECTFLS